MLGRESVSEPPVFHCNKKEKVKLQRHVMIYLKEWG